MRRRLTSRPRKPPLNKRVPKSNPAKRNARALPTPPPPGRRAEFLTPTQVADRLLVAAVTVRLWASKGMLPSVTTLGGHRRFLAEDVEAFAAQHQPTAARRQATRILIIDDDREFSGYLAKLIAANARGVVVDVANDGFSAGVTCQATRPDIVILDLQMPDMDGFEVCAMLRTMFGRRRPRIVALTAFPSEKSVRRILAAGADACLAKGTPVKTLLQELGLARSD
jgi:excisionase family DNA binding protein